MSSGFKFKTAQNSKNLRLNGHISFEFQTRNNLHYVFRSHLQPLERQAGVFGVRKNLSLPFP